MNWKISISQIQLCLYGVEDTLAFWCTHSYDWWLLISWSVRSLSPTKKIWGFSADPVSVQMQELFFPGALSGALHSECFSFTEHKFSQGINHALLFFFKPELGQCRWRKRCSLTTICLQSIACNVTFTFPFGPFRLACSTYPGSLVKGRTVSLSDSLALLLAICVFKAFAIHIYWGIFSSLQAVFPSHKQQKATRYSICKWQCSHSLVCSNRSSVTNNNLWHLCNCFFLGGGFHFFFSLLICCGIRLMPESSATM